MKLLHKAIGFALISFCGSVFFSVIIAARDPSRFWFALMITTAWIWALGLGIALMTWREL